MYTPTSGKNVNYAFDVCNELAVILGYLWDNFNGLCLFTYSWVLTINYMYLTMFSNTQDLVKYYCVFIPSSKHYAKCILFTAKIVRERLSFHGLKWEIQHTLHFLLLMPHAVQTPDFEDWGAAMHLRGCHTCRLSMVGMSILKFSPSQHAANTWTSPTTQNFYTTRKLWGWDTDWLFPTTLPQKRTSDSGHRSGWVIRAEKYNWLIGPISDA